MQWEFLTRPYVAWRIPRTDQTYQTLRLLTKIQGPNISRGGGPISGGIKPHCPRLKGISSKQ